MISHSRPMLQLQLHVHLLLTPSHPFYVFVDTYTRVASRMRKPEASPGLWFLSLLIVPHALRLTCRRYLLLLATLTKQTALITGAIFTGAGAEISLHTEYLRARTRYSYATHASAATHPARQSSSLASHCSLTILGRPPLASTQRPALRPADGAIHVNVRPRVVEGLGVVTLALPPAEKGGGGSETRRG